MTKRTIEKTTKKLAKMMSLVLTAALLFGTMGLEASASELDSAGKSQVKELEAHVIPVLEESTDSKPDVRALLYNCMITMSPTNAGMSISFLTDCVQVASRIGVKDIVIQKKVWYGWKTVATSSGAENRNTRNFGCSILYSGVEQGEIYRISCVHYAYADEYTEVVNQGDGFTYYL